MKNGPFKKTCVVCGAVYLAPHTKHMTCSEECRREYRRQKAKENRKNHPEKAKEYKKNNAEKIKQYQAQYMAKRALEKKSLAKPVTAICDYCGAEYEKRSKKSKYCSNRCKYHDRKGKAFNGLVFPENVNTTAQKRAYIHKSELKTKTCKCGAEIITMYPHGQRYCKECALKNTKISSKNSMKNLTTSGIKAIQYKKGVTYETMKQWPSQLFDLLREYHQLQREIWRLAHGNSIPAQKRIE